MQVIEGVLVMRMENTLTLNKCPKDAIVIPLFENHLEDVSIVKKYDKALHTALSKLLKPGDFKAGFGSVISTYADSGAFKRIVIAGCGKLREFDTEKLRRLIAQVDGIFQSYNIRGYTVFMPTLLPFTSSDYLSGKAVAEAVVLSRFNFITFKSKKDKKIKGLNVVFWNAPKGDFQKGIKDGRVIADNVNTIRELISMPSNVLTPVKIAETAQDIAAKTDGITCEVFDEEKIKSLNFNGIIAVGKGSVNPPRFVVMEYDGSNGSQKKPIIIVGKGVSFDTGGISLKPWSGMEKMKYDMAGSGVVLGVMKTAAELKLPLKLVGLIPTVENMPGSNAYKPGDVITMASGLTVEVISTDAEGRLILADALHYACDAYKPEAVIDLATLTGACAVALGSKACAIMGNNRGLIRRFQQNADNAGEKVWELPMWPEYDELIKSDIADIKNSGGPGAGTIVGGVFLKQFIKNAPWLHLDIASTSWKDSSEKGYLGKGATGFGIRLLCEILRNWNA